MVQFSKCVTKLKLKLSNKAKIVASRHVIAKLLHKELQDHGMVFEISKCARDLGISHSAAVSRPNKLLVSQFRKVSNRISKIKNIAKISRHAKKLFTGSAYASCTWGHQACGVSESAIIQLERDALSSTGISPAGRCRTISLCTAFGVLGTPRARIIRDTFREWFCIVRSFTDVCQIRLLMDAWTSAISSLASTPASCRKVRGLLSNVICILLRAGWSPSAFNRWEDRDGDVWILNGSISPDKCSSAVIKSMLSVELVRANEHCDGKGIANGVDFNATLSLVRNSSSNYPFMCTLQSILSACMWPAERVAKCASSLSPICPRCGQDVESSLHCFWTCPANAHIEDCTVADTQSLVQTAVACSTDEPCMWLRGILPSHHTAIDNTCLPSVDLKVIYEHEVDAVWSSGIFYGDPSGGELTGFTDIRRCGCAVVSADTNGQLRFGARFNLPGIVQTVPRAELFCLVWLVRRLTPLSDIEYITDNKGLYDTFWEALEQAALV